MVLDIIILIIMVATMVFGFRKGFIYTFSHTLGWIGALIGGFILSPILKKWLIENTQFQAFIKDFLLDKFNASTGSLATSSQTVPSIIGGGVNPAIDNATNAFTETLTGLILTLVSFLIILIVIKLILFLITIVISKKRNPGFIGFFDGFLGLIAGMIKGVIFVFVFLALIIPFANMTSLLSTELIVSTLDSSYFARTLYDNNFVVLLVTDFLQ
ncbi:MAG: CvpA family protein [Anaerovoracaceae bacterium]